MTEEQIEQKAEDFYFKKYTKTLNIGEEQRFKAITEAYIAGATEATNKLQEENDKLKKEKIPQLEHKIASIRGAHSVDCKKLNSRIEQVERLKKENKTLERRILRSKECMKKLLFIVEENHLNCKGLIQDAKDFIHNNICLIRKQDQHCITEEPCIMCDRD